MNLFIDTNVYLSFYHFSNDDLEELNKLSVAIDNKKIKLFITEHAISEYKRNRDAKIADALKRFVEQKAPTQFPQICKEYKEFDDLRKCLSAYEVYKSRILTSLKSDIEHRTLGADKIILDLFSRATTIPLKDEYFDKALRRHQLGNPPGKKDSIGDAVNWTCLASAVPENEEMFFISNDKDYFSVLAEENPCHFLVDEWKTQKGSEIWFYRSLSDFFREKFPDIKLASELEKELAIKNFVNSSSFDSTHKAIKKLTKFNDLTSEDINQIISASVTNNQIYLIKEDEDIRSFLFGLAENYEEEIDTDLWNAFQDTFTLEDNQPEYEFVDGIPF